MIRKQSALSLFFVLCSTAASWGQTPQFAGQREPLAVQPAQRITAQIDDTQRHILTGQHHPLAKPENEIGELPSEQPMNQMVLVLSPDPAQQAALEELLRAQQDPESPYYHKWLTPEDFGQHFGVSESDLNQIANWLRSQGMQVEEIPPSHLSIVFSGNAGQVSSAFHTPMRSYLVEGQQHYANASDPGIPLAFAGVVSGVLSLHDFRSLPNHSVVKPQFTAGGGAHYLAPKDWDTIYDVLPLFSQGFDGTGQTIAVLGRSDITLSDVTTFRTTFGLSTNPPQIITNGADPGIVSGDVTESTLDVEWAGAIAQNTTVKFVTSKSGSSDGIALSAQYAVTKNVAPIISLSYGQCEAALGSSGNTFWNSLWSQAASQGISVFVSSGDSGAAGCDPSGAQTATHGRGVNGLCTSPYSTCVGGTEFNDTANPSLYWSGSNSSSGSSAVSYIPELAWNESASSNGAVGSGGGVSITYTKPTWQSAPGVPSDGMRDVPDVAMAAAVHDAYLIELQGQLNAVGGTSAATPSFASAMALLLQSAKSSQGNINPILYSLANSQLSGTSSNTVVFHDITVGNNTVPGVTGFNATTGYDQVTGLGSVDAYMLVNQWSAAASSNFSISLNAPNLSVGQGSSNTLTLTLVTAGGFNSPVTPSATGLPTGVTVSFSPKTLTGSAPVTATFTATSTASAATTSIGIVGTASGLTRTTPLLLSVVTPSFTLTPSASSVSVTAGSSSSSLTVTSAVVNGFKSAISLSVSGLPKGVTAAFSPASIASPGNGTSSLTLTAASTATAATSTLTITATGARVTKTQTVTLTIAPAPSFTLTAGSTTASMLPGATATVTMTTTVLNGFNAAVALSVTGLPKGVTAVFTPTSIAAPGNGTSTLTLTASSTATPGSSALTITGTGGNVSKTSSVTLTVLAPPNFTLASSPTSATLATGATASFNLSTTVLNGFNSAVALSVTGLPKGVTASFSTTSIAAPGSGTSKMTLTASSTATTGTSTLTVTGTGGGVTKTVTITLAVKASTSN